VIDKNKIAISYSVTQNYKQLRAYWQKKQKGKKVIFDTSIPLGGELKIKDKTYEYNQPYGFKVLDWDSLLHVVTSAKDNSLFLNGEGFNKKEIVNSAFNDVHDVLPTSRGFLVVSSGLDCILEVDNEGNTLWSHYFMFDNNIIGNDRLKFAPQLAKNKNLVPEPVGG